MKYLIRIPHQMPADLLDFTDSAFNELSEQDKDDLTHDLHNDIWIKSEEDLKYALNYHGHQEIKVHALANSISSFTLTD
jgi:hypothetical protein